MNIKPVKKVNKSSDKKQKQRGKKQNPRKFLENFTKKLNQYRKPEIAKSKQTATQKQYKSKSLHEEIYKREVAKNKSYSKVYSTLNDKKVVSRKKEMPQKQNTSSQIIKKETSRVSTQTDKKYNNKSNKKTISYSKTITTSNGYHSTRLRYSGSRAYSSARESYYSSRREQTPFRRGYYSKSAYVTSKSNSTTKKAYSTSKSQVRRTTKPQSNISSKKTQSRTNRNQPQRTKTQSTVKRTQTKASPSVSAKTNTAKSRYTSNTSQKPQQLMTSVQKRAKGVNKPPTKSIERMLDEYSQAYKKPKVPARTVTNQKPKNALPQTRGRTQPLTKKEEVKEFKKGIASTKTRDNDIAYIEYKKSLNKRVAMQRRMNNRNNRER